MNSLEPLDITAEWKVEHNDKLKRYRAIMTVIMSEDMGELVIPMLQKGFEVLMRVILEKLQKDGNIEDLVELRLTKEEALAMGDKAIHELYKSKKDEMN